MTDWHRRAWVAIRELAYGGTDFDSDDLIAVVGHPDTNHAANGANNALGTIFRQAHVGGLIEPTGEVRQSRQGKRKGGMVRVWRGVGNTLF